MALLWANVGKYPDIDLILIQCYSGWRPRELCYLRLDDVDLNARTFTGGLKTNAGKNRIVPIHPRIFDLVQARYQKSVELGSPYFVFISLKVKCARYAIRGSGCTIKISLPGLVLTRSISPMMAGSTSSPWPKNTTWTSTLSSESSVIILQTSPNEFIQSAISNSFKMRLKRFHNFQHFLYLPPLKV